MATVTRSVAGKPDREKKVYASALKVDLPDEKSEPVDDFEEYSVLIHGEKKIGKTTLATVEADDTFLLTFDPIQKSYALKQRYCPDWAHFEAYLKALEKRAADGEYTYKRVVLDGADSWHKHATRFACKKLGISHPSDEDWGKGWDAVNQLFVDAIDRVLALPGGKWFISHSVWKEVEVRTGRKTTKLMPLMGGRAEDQLVGKLDAWFAYDYVEKERVLVVRGDERVGAGCRINGHFQTPTGRLVAEVPMGDSAEEAWTNLQRAFDNRQQFTTLEDRDEQAERAAKKKTGGKASK